MKRLFDSSAIFKAVNENRVEVLAGNYTLDLARYELGNIVWKDSALQAKISEQSAKKLMKIVGRTLSYGCGGDFWVGGEYLGNCDKCEGYVL
ncbi:MAG TPA: hypothetical protein VLH35_05085 [Candidatus Acidoferrales bacterium]|nr:hypothetical protein [Candidatus Acidoferrales bacterium]